ncbi:hypothetical protein MNBD_ALPHA12-731 [hydrothermal vent metagenome]|uniref:Uncharacterized protein n=1 Tax=hydrothermal vent metagenome TaxID=652676 RepID=A0A3B0TMD8_9ZZZZ
MFHAKKHQNLLKSLLVLVLSALFFSAPSHAASFDSVYTKLDLNDCKQIPYSATEVADGASYACMGYDNTLVYVAEGDLRMFVSYGLNALKEKAAQQTLPAFNTINDTLEWRLIYENGKWQPFATILRWYTQSGDPSSQKGEILVVTKLEPGNVCHVAYINARLVPEANKIARDIADKTVAGFNCKTDKAINIPGE